MPPLPLRLPLLRLLVLSSLTACLVSNVRHQEPQPRSADDPVVKLNQIQVIGSHNSYHIAPEPAALKLIETGRPGAGRALSYTHRALAEQFGKLGIRQIELDLFADPKGGLYANPKSARLGKPAPAQADEPSDFDPNGVLKKPGLKVLHVPDIDFRTTALTFVQALEQVKAWSRAHPRHVPIFILVELKDEPYPTLTKPVPFDKDQLDAIDAEILSVFDREAILTPDDVRGEHETLPKALKEDGWPALEDVRGKVMFALDNEDKIRDRYLEGHPTSKDRLLFVSVKESDPSAGWMKVNDAIRDFDRIQGLISDGFLVRTRADIDTVEARKNDVTRRDKALASGAQFVSTDFREPSAGVLRLSGPAPGRRRGPNQSHQRRQDLRRDRPRSPVASQGSLTRPDPIQDGFPESPEGRSTIISR